MIDLYNLEKYKENNCIEAKRAIGGLPESIWETYSAFANTFGGIILLGVEELPNKSLHAVGVPEPELLIEEFWDIINNPKLTSANILSPDDVYTENINGKNIVVINVPKANENDKPIYVYGNPSGTYLRNGDGDYKCTREE